MKNERMMRSVVHYGAGEDIGKEGLFVQLAGESEPLAVKAIIGDTSGDRRLQVQRLDSSGDTLEVDEIQAQAIWSGPQALPEPQVQRYGDLQLAVVPQEHADRYHAGRRYLVRTHDMLPHNAFSTAEQLDSWASERGLRLPAPAKELRENPFQRIDGQYQVATHGTTLTFSAVDGVWTRDIENGSVTAAQTVLDRSTGVVTVHRVGSNCKAREEFDHLLWPEPGERVVMYVPGERHVYDELFLRDGEDGEEVFGMFSRKSLVEMRMLHPNGLQMTVSEAAARIEQLAKTQVKAISEEAFRDALDMLPPEGWIRCGSTESFKCMERYSGLVTSIYARVGDQHFTFRDVCTLGHEMIVERVRSSGLLQAPTVEDEESSSFRMR